MEEDRLFSSSLIFVLLTAICSSRLHTFSILGGDNLCRKTGGVKPLGKALPQRKLDGEKNMKLNKARVNLFVDLAIGLAALVEAVSGFVLWLVLPPMWATRAGAAQRSIRALS